MTSSIFRKNLMALTGLFLCFFLVIHLVGNLQLLLPPEKAAVQFNIYSRILSGNILIKVISWVLFAAIILHSVYAVVLTIKNNKASGGKYAYDKRGGASTWQSRNMGLLGSVIFLFLVMHLKDYWYSYSFTQIPLDSEGNKDLFTIVVTSYKDIWYVALNIIAFIALGYHLIHGINSAFKSLGAYPKRLAKFLYFSGIALAVLLTVGFVFIPIFVHLNYHL
ncbi:succinate dehydrogenase cytochrome b subunit [Flammeovirgaceae bacterium SG7u.111]|nr:succinate dehydrogenase cytochrome b subunit [Flammeovirgaceae bacterium SG7u.132]WPO36766.1 succinate dehydrogenase cytochrome b subunit [Flammeovirgaceae bacterium SG7u.111]